MRVGFECAVQEWSKIFNPHWTLVRTNFQLKSSYDVTVACFHVYVFVLFTSYNNAMGIICNLKKLDNVTLYDQSKMSVLWGFSISFW